MHRVKYAGLFSRWHLFTVLAVLLAARSSRSTPLEPEGRDVVEGESLRLSCNFNPALASRNLLYFWFRTNRHGKENAAISGSALDPHYSVEYNPAEGRYALLISRAQYDKDNGHYECKLKESGSGADVHNAAYDVTVLIAPGEPRITPSSPTALEGEPLALTCASEGGSPDPDVEWFRGDERLPSALTRGGARDRPTAAVLTLTPGREDDGAEFRCRITNRAMPQGSAYEARTTIRVHYAPKITVGPHNPLNVMVGTDATLTCSVLANPPVRSVRWMKRGQLLSKDRKSVV